MKTSTMIKNTYVLDTNILLVDPNALYAYNKHDIVLPFIVLEELDKHKVRQDEVGANARAVSRKLHELIKNSKYSFKDGIPIRDGDVDGGMIKIISSSGLMEGLVRDANKDSADNRILAVCIELEQHSQTSGKVILVSNDVLLRVKASANDIETEEYDKYQTPNSSNEIYSGIRTVTITSDILSELWENKKDREYLAYAVERYVGPCEPNEFIVFSNKTLGEPFMVRYMGHEAKFVPEYFDIQKIKPRNEEQRFAVDLLLDPSVSLVTCVGFAGTGKTLLAIAAGLEQVVDKKRYKTLIICRPIQPLGKDIGFLPGPQPLDAKILTPTGWTTMGELKIGSDVIGRDGKSTKVLNVFPKGQKDVFKISTTDGSSTECCEDHLWLTQTWEEKKRGRFGHIKTTKEIIKSLKVNKNKKIKLNHYLPRNEAVEFATKKLPLPPYTLGVLLGDGYIGNSISFTGMDDEIVERVRSEILDLGCKVHNVKNTIKEICFQMGLTNHRAWEKFIPDEYLHSSTVEQRLDLLRGLMDTDRTIKKNGEASYTTTSKKLAENVQELVRSLGGKAVIRTPKNRIGRKSVVDNREITVKRKSCKFTVSIPKHFNPSRLLKKAKNHKCCYTYDNQISSIEFVGKKEVQCILVENPEHLYVTDDYIVTHNTIEEKLEPWIAPIKDNLRFLLSSGNGNKNKNSESTLNYYFDRGIIEVEAMAYIRGRSIPNAYMIIDEAQNLSMHELKTIITRAGEGTKIVLTGDVEQIDNLHVDSMSNGLSVAVEKFKQYEIAGHVTLTHGERSELASLAAEILKS